MQFWNRVGLGHLSLAAAVLCWAALLGVLVVGWMPQAEQVILAPEQATRDVRAWTIGNATATVDGSAIRLAQQQAGQPFFMSRALPDLHRLQGSAFTLSGEIQSRREGAAITLLQPDLKHHFATAKQSEGTWVPVSVASMLLPNAPTELVVLYGGYTGKEAGAGPVAFRNVTLIVQPGPQYRDFIPYLFWIAAGLSILTAALWVRRLRQAT
jgi:hypothetical protein